MVASAGGKDASESRAHPSRQAGQSPCGASPGMAFPHRGQTTVGAIGSLLAGGEPSTHAQKQTPTMVTRPANAFSGTNTLAAWLTRPLTGHLRITVAHR